ncbi:hypothetical protein [Kitasatospora sp. NPDC005751]|uniref:hypothetical protein n=1 Tax=Kitasatospora sp. NPDC005751 TaxID=3157064 RepID=UPI0033C1C9BA
MTAATVYRPVGTARIKVRLPYAVGNRAWIHSILGDLTRPEWNREDKSWDISRQHMRTLVEALAERFGSVDVTIDFRTNSRCDDRCRDAEGDDCDCQCMGENHGGAAYWRNWREVGETTLVATAGISQRVFRVVSR